MICVGGWCPCTVSAVMGKSSSAKKIARVAKSGGTVKARQSRKWGFPLAIAGIVVLGTLLIVFVRADQVTQASEPPQLGKDHWHTAYGIYVCDTFTAALTDTQGDRYGIHSHGDGLIHIHPTSSNTSGAKATLGVFADEEGLVFGDDSFTLPSGETYATGDDCNGEPGEVRVLKWSSGDFEGDPEVFTSDFGSIRFEGNGEAIVIAFAPADAEIPLPPSLAGINEVSDLAPGEEAPQVSVPEDLVTIPPTTAGSTDTTAVPAEGTSDTTPTTAAPADGSSDTTPTTAG